MTRMLGALVASMTIGALCLDWMQPVRTAAPTGPGIELIARGPAGRTWEGIRIEARPQDRALHPEDSHFIIHPNGNEVRTPSWKAQRILGSAPIVQVTLVAAPGPQSLTSVQRSAARNLVHQLQLDYSIPAGRIKGADNLVRDTLSQSDADPADMASLARAE